MIREVTLPTEDLSLIREEMRLVGTSDNVVVFRQGTRGVNKERWIALLETECGLLPDRRHFDLQEQLNLADWWEVSYQPERETAYAYSKTPQPLHTDNAWFANPAEINFFIMARQARAGGEQTLYPLARLLEDLSIDEPGLLNDLTSVEVVIKKGSHDFYNKTTIIRLEPEPVIFWNYYRTEKSRPEVLAMCDAFFKYLAGRLKTSSVQQLRCETGDCFSFNDLKMLHGRTGFEANRERDRVLLHSMWKLT